MPLSVYGHKYQEMDGCLPEVDAALEPDFTPPAACPSCEQALEPVKGLRSNGAADTRTRTSVGVSDSGVARTGYLFSRETLTHGQALSGEILSDDPGLLAELADLGVIRIGGRRTTHGLGQISTAPPSADPALRPEVRTDGVLLLRLAAPAVFVDDDGRPATGPSDAQLSTALGASARVVRRWYRWHAIGGWHMASGLPKPTELAVAAGSTYAVRVDPVDPGRLAQLLTSGVGLRRHEGFGHLQGPPQLLAAPQRDAARQAQRQSEATAQQAAREAAAGPYLSLRAFPAILDAVAAALDGELDPTDVQTQADGADSFRVLGRQVAHLFALPREQASAAVAFLKENR